MLVDASATGRSFVQGSTTDCVYLIMCDQIQQPILVAEKSNARVYCLSFAGITGSNPAGGMDVCLL